MAATGPPALSALRVWLRRHDPEYAALRRAARAALIMPAVFALADKVIANPALATFAAFGSFAMLLLVDFTGSMRDRLLDQAALGVACTLLICLGTLASRTTWLAAVSMGLVALIVLFAGTISSVFAGASTCLLLAFILPVSLPAPASSIPDRAAGWGLAAAASLFAISLLWPAPTRNPVRTAAVNVCRALADRLRAEVRYVTAGDDARAREAHSAAIKRADEASTKMERLFFGVPYRPTGLSAEARAWVHLVDELRWLSAIVLRSAPRRHPPLPAPHACAVKRAAAEVLERVASSQEHPREGRAELRATLDELRAELVELERATVDLTPAAAALAPGEQSVHTIVNSLDPSFSAQSLGFLVAHIAANADYAAAAAQRSWLERLLGRRPEDLPGPLAAAQLRAGARVDRNSLWLQNSLRGASALALAVLVADLSAAQHAFWVAFGTLSVLRSSALNTGQSVLRALAGTAGGFIVGGALVAAIGPNRTVLWALLPIAVLLAGLAPAAISFAAGQAGFTLTLLILFNILTPVGWKIGIVRVEDVAIGCAVSLVVGLLFWPRGAAAALGRTLARAYSESAGYLADAVASGAGRLDSSGAAGSSVRRRDLDALAAALRLDDAFRSYLADRGSKPAPLADMAGLVTGVTGIRIVADAVRELWNGDRADDGGYAASRSELANAGYAVTGWYERLAAALAGDEAVPDSLASDERAGGRLLDALERDVHDAGGHPTATSVRVIWTADHIDAVRRLQETLVAPARAVASPRERARDW